MIHPNTQLTFISKEVGYGVVATELIPAGTITWVLDDLDREFTPLQVKNMPMAYQNIIEFYSYRNNLGNLILCWDHGRYVNHSFKSNCITTAYDFEIAIRDILPGEEITDDYGYLNISAPFKGIEEGTKRKIVYPDDLVHHHKIWDKQLLENFPKIIEVDQLLKDWIKPHTWEKVIDVIEGKEVMQSILTNYFSDFS